MIELFIGFAGCLGEERSYFVIICCCIGSFFMFEIGFGIWPNGDVLIG